MDDKRNQRPDSQPGDRAANQNDTGKDKRREEVKRAHDEAEKDILNDAELSAHSPNDDLDEGETARLGDGKNPLV